MAAAGASAPVASAGPPDADRVQHLDPLHLPPPEHDPDAAPELPYWLWPQHAAPTAAPRQDPPLLVQARQAVSRLPADERRSEEERDALAAGAACLAHANGLVRVDHVYLSGSGDGAHPGERLFVVEGDPSDPAHRRAHMLSSDARATDPDQARSLLPPTTEQAPAAPPATVEAEPTALDAMLGVPPPAAARNPTHG